MGTRRVVGVLVLLAMALGAFAVPLVTPGGASGAAVLRSPSGVAPGHANPANTLTGVSCPGAAFCVAVGASSDATNTNRALIEMWDGTGWTVAVNADLSDSSGYLSGVSCTSTTFCVAVGTVGPPGAEQFTGRPLVETWNGTAWSVRSAPGADGERLSAVSCTGTAACTAVGTDDRSVGQQRTLVESWNGTTWSIVPSPNPGSPYSALSGVSCTSTSACVAVGTQFDQASTWTRTLVEAWDGSTWTVVPSPSPASGGSILTAVSCATASSCLAVGFVSDQEAGITATVAEHWDGTVWSTTPGSPGGSGAFQGVSCTGPSACTAVGYFQPDGSVTQPVLAATWDGSTWTVRPTPATGGSYGLLAGVSCPTGGFCAAVGQVLRPPGIMTTMAFTWDGSGWSVVPTPNVSALVAPTAALAATPSGDGYWIADLEGDVVARGAAPYHGSLAGVPLAASIAGITSTADGGGYWLVAGDGGVFAFGDAAFYGSMGGLPLTAPVVGMAPTADGRGYWLVAADGGVFAFGDARFQGSMGGHPLNQPVVGMSRDRATGGYWLLAGDGGIFAFGAEFQGSMGGRPLNEPAVAIAGTPDGAGYWLAASDGGIFAFGDAPFQGSMGGQPLNEPIVGMAGDPGTGGYWMVATDGGIFSFAAPFYGARA